MIAITVNGQAREVAEGSTLADLLAQLVVSPQALATAVNGDFVARDLRAAHLLKPGDQVFTFQPITGG
jgi:sulfur carrier protein